MRKHLSVANVLSAIALFVALSGAAYAATTAAKNSVKASSIAKGAVTTAKLRNGAVAAGKLRNGAVTTSKIATGAVGASQIGNGAVRAEQLGGSVVTSAKLKSGAVTAEKLAANAVGASQLGANSVATAKIQEGAVSASKLSSSVLANVVKNVSYVSGVSGSGPSPNLKTATAECIPSATRKQVIGGGARILGANTKVALIESAPKLDAAGNRIGWTAAANEFAEESEAWAIEAFAICAEF